MPCRIKIKENIKTKVRELSIEGLGLSQAEANKIATKVNTYFGETVLRYGYFGTSDLIEADITVSETLIDKYYANELIIEEREATAIHKAALDMQIEDAARAGKKYSNDYLFDNNEELKYQEMSINQKDLDATKAITIATTLGNKLAAAFNMDYKIVSPREAELVLQNSNTPYDGQGAFFFNNTIFFTEGNFNVNNVLHEYAHPLIKGLAQTNSVLFNKLYNKLKSTDAGKAIIETVISKYPNLEIDSDRFKEEALVRSLEKISADEVAKKTETESGFKEFINNLLFAIKQILRKLSKKVNLKNLKASTTLEELANMLVNEDFIIEDLNLKLSDFAEFRAEIEELHKDLVYNRDNQILIDLINKTYGEISNEISSLERTPNKLKKELKEGTDILKNVKRELRGYQTIGEIGDKEVADAMRLEQEEFRVRSIAFVNSINEISVWVHKINGLLDQVKNKKQHFTHEGIAKVMYYQQFLASQKRFLKSIRQTIDQNPNNILSSRILSISAVVADASDKTGDLVKEFVSEFFTDGVADMNESIENNMKERITKILEINKIPEEQIKSAIKQIIESEHKEITPKDIGLPESLSHSKTFVETINKYFLKRLNKQVIDKFLNGEKGDLSMLSAMIVPYSNIDDPLTGSLITFLRDKLSDIQNKTNKEENAIRLKLEPLLKKFGYNPSNTKQLSDALLDIDTIGTQNKDGDFETFEVYSFMSRFGNGWRSDLHRLKFNIEKAKTDEDQDAIFAAVKALAKFNEDYMFRHYTDEYYAASKLWDQENELINPITKEKITISAEQSALAAKERRTKIHEMNTYSKSNYKSEDEDGYTTDPYLEAQKDYKALFNYYDDDGILKSGDELKRVLLRLKHKDMTKNFYDYETNDKKLQVDFDLYVKNNITDAGISIKDNPEEFIKKVQEYTKKNFKTSFTDEYFKEKNRINQALNDLSARNKNSNPAAAQLASLYVQRSGLVTASRNEKGTPDGQVMSAGQQDLLKNIEEQIVALQESYDQKTGLSKEDARKLSDYSYRLGKSATALNAEEKTEYSILFNKAADSGMSPADTAEFNKLIGELNELTDKEPTQEYIDAFNKALRDVDDVDEVTMKNVSEWIKSRRLDHSLKRSQKFKEWFERNHYLKDVYTKKAGEKKGEKIPTLLRTNVWTITKPADNKYFRTTTLINPITGKEMRIPGVPNSSFTEKIIKDEYLTISRDADPDDYVGVITNNKGEYLPRSYKRGEYKSAVDAKYINTKYEQLESSNSIQFQLLEAMKKEYIGIQKGKLDGSKLYLDLARYRQHSNMEYIQSGQAKGDLKRRGEAIKGAWKSSYRKAADDAQNDFNFNPNALLVSTDQEGNAINKVPIEGLYRLKVGEVSTDITFSMFRYMQSLNEQQGTSEMLAPLEAIKQVLSSSDAQVKDLTKASKQIAKSTGLMAFMSSDTNNRAKAINYLIDKALYGKTNSKEDSPTAMKLANKMMGAASRSFIMLDVTSALKNRYGMMLQSMIEASGGKYINAGSLARGRGWSTKAVGNLMTTGIYSRGPKSLELQIMENFDPITGKTRKDFGKSSSRTFMKDFMDGTWMYDFRRLTDLEAGLQVFGGMMYRKHVTQIQKDGKEKLIPYMDAFELNADKQMVLKEGIDPSYGTEHVKHLFEANDTWESLAKKYNVTIEELQKRNKDVNITDLQVGDEIVISKSEKFKTFQRQVQGVGSKLNGQIGQLNNPQANKYLAFRLFTFYKKYATSMFLNRFQANTKDVNIFKKGKRLKALGEVYDWDMTDTTKGYYITGLQAMQKVLFDAEKYWPLMTTEEKVAIKKMLAEGVLLAVLGIIAGFLFGYDPGDEDRFEKMREREKEYGTAGWLANHVLYQVIMVQTENEAFIPVPGLGLGDWLEFTNNSTIATGPTIGVWGKIVGDLIKMSTGDSKAVYSQDAGPYPWQVEGRYKLWNHLFALVGVKGKNYSPITAIKKAEIFENTKL